MYPESIWGAIQYVIDPIVKQYKTYNTAAQINICTNTPKIPIRGNASRPNEPYF